MYCIELDERYVKFYSQDLSIGYQKLLPRILQIKNSVIKSIVRFLLSHVHIKIGLDKTLDAVGYPLFEISETKQRVFYKELREAKSFLKESFNIDYDDTFKIFEYSKHEDVCFEWPNKEPAKELGYHSPATQEELLHKTITRKFFDGSEPITAKISKITETTLAKSSQKQYILFLQFPDNRILEISETFSSLEEIKKIID